jgi:ketosteroid isomerase-like protein
MTQQTIDQAARNAARLEAGYEAFARGDLVAVEEMFATDAVWHVQRLGQLGGDHRGWPAILTFFGRSMELTEGTFRIEIREVLANDEGAAAAVRSSARRGEQTLDDRQVHLFHMERDKVVEVWQFVGDGLATEAFWS